MALWHQHDHLAWSQRLNKELKSNIEFGVYPLFSENKGAPKIYRKYYPFAYSSFASNPNYMRDSSYEYRQRFQVAPADGIGCHRVLSAPQRNPK